MKVIKADEFISEIEKWKEGTKKSTPKEIVLKQVLLLAKKKTIDVEEKRFFEKGVEGRRKKLESYYDYVLPIIAEIYKQGNTTAYSIVNILNERGERTVTGKAFREVIVTKLMNLAKERGLC